MGKRIRLTVTITITDTWTFGWMTEDDPPTQTGTIVQDTSKEEQNEALQATLEEAAGQSSANDPMAQTPPPNDASACANTRHQRNRTLGCCATDNLQSI